MAGSGDEAEQNRNHDADEQHSNGDSSSKSDDDKSDKPKSDGGKQKKRSKVPLIILGVVVVLAIIGGVIYWLANRGLETTDDAQVDGDVVTMAPKVAGYVVSLNVTDNQRVKAGDLLVQIDQRDYKIAREQAAAQIDLAKAQLANAEANYETQLIQAPAKLAQAQAQEISAEANAANALSESRRQTSIDKRATSQQSIDSADAQSRAANANVAYNKAQVQVAKLIPQQIDQARAQVDQAKAQIEQAEAQLANADLNLSYTEVRAPQDGWVTRRNVQLGSYLVAGQSLFSLVTQHSWITANFKETQLDHMRRGQHVKIEVDAYPDLKLDGHVDSIQMGSGSRFSAFPAENATGNYVKIVQRVPVKIVIDHGLDPNLPLPFGLSVEPTVDVGR